MVLPLKTNLSTLNQIATSKSLLNMYEKYAYSLHLCQSLDQLYPYE